MRYLLSILLSSIMFSSVYPEQQLENPEIAMITLQPGNTTLIPGCAYMACIDDIAILKSYPSLICQQKASTIYLIEIPVDFPADLIEKLQKEDISFGEWTSKALPAKYISKEGHNQIVKSIPQSNRYTESSAINAKINEPFLISLSRSCGTWSLELNDEQKQYFSSILKYDDEEGNTNFILVPFAATVEPFCFGLIFREHPSVTLEYPPRKEQTFSITFAIEISK